MSKVNVRVDGQTITFDSNNLAKGKKVSGFQVMNKINKSFEMWYLNMKDTEGMRSRVYPDDLVNVTKKKFHRFETVAKQTQQGGD